MQASEAHSCYGSQPNHNSHAITIIASLQALLLSCYGVGRAAYVHRVSLLSPHDFGCARSQSLEGALRVRDAVLVAMCHDDLSQEMLLGKIHSGEQVMADVVIDAGH